MMRMYIFCFAICVKPTIGYVAALKHDFCSRIMIDLFDSKNMYKVKRAVLTCDVIRKVREVQDKVNQRLKFTKARNFLDNCFRN